MLSLVFCSESGLSAIIAVGDREFYVVHPTLCQDLDTGGHLLGENPVSYASCFYRAQVISVAESELAGSAIDRIAGLLAHELGHAILAAADLRRDERDAERFGAMLLSSAYDRSVIFTTAELLASGAKRRRDWKANKAAIKAARKLTKKGAK